MKTINAYVLSIMMLIALSAAAQSDKDKALTMARQAIAKERDGDIAGAIKILEEAQQLDKDNTDYTYEIAYAHYLNKDYKEAQQLLRNIISSKTANDRYYQLLGNTYDMQGDSTGAVTVYKQGLAKFPKSGKLYTELGLVYINQKNYNKALNYFEKGIQIDPQHASNYYWATRIYCSSDQEVWGMIYGEIFINLESESKRTAEISKLLYDTYKSEITYPTDTSMSISFCNNAMLTPEQIKKHKLPFGNFGYELPLTLAVVGTHSITLNSLDTIRRNFINTFYEQKKNKDYPNILFDYQKDLLTQGYLSAYNHWLLMHGDEKAFAEWASAHKEEITNFIKWYPVHKLNVTDDHRFYREQY
ncbi:MAG: tetratricopeptide repeat protein [Bacteroidetes bacterium]|nr:tetratricopeptide repeat protein [Bacteroidota bacterium]